MNRRVFLDSGIFIALLNSRDHWHSQARELFATPPRLWCTSLLVVAETYGWFLHRMGEDAAHTFRDFLAHLPDLHVLGADLAHHRAVGEMLSRLRGHKLTYVDASSLSFLVSERLDMVWATDRDLSLTGVEVRPRA